jgi:hypothetical protein
MCQNDNNNHAQDAPHWLVRAKSCCIGHAREAMGLAKTGQCLAPSRLTTLWRAIFLHTVTCIKKWSDNVACCVQKRETAVISNPLVPRRWQRRTLTMPPKHLTELTSVSAMAPACVLNRVFQVAQTHHDIRTDVVCHLTKRRRTNATLCVRMHPLQLVRCADSRIDPPVYRVSYTIRGTNSTTLSSAAEAMCTQHNKKSLLQPFDKQDAPPRPMPRHNLCSADPCPNAAFVGVQPCECTAVARALQGLLAACCCRAPSLYQALEGRPREVCCGAGSLWVSTAPALVDPPLRQDVCGVSGSCGQARLTPHSSGSRTPHISTQPWRSAQSSRRTLGAMCRLFVDPKDTWHSTASTRLNPHNRFASLASLPPLANPPPKFFSTLPHDRLAWLGLTSLHPVCVPST